MKEKTQIKFLKKIKYSEGQVSIIQTQCRRRYRDSAGLDFVIDEEHYFILSKPKIPGNSFYCRSDTGIVS